MKEITVKLTGQNKKSRIALLVFSLGLLLVLALLYMPNKNYRWLNEMLFMSYGVVMIYGATRYVFCVYTYEIVCLEEEWLLIVTATYGKRNTTLCRMKMDQLESISAPMTSRKQAKSITRADKESIFYVFHKNAIPERICFVTFVDTDGEKSVLSLEAEESFYQTLMENHAFLQNETM